MAPGEAIIRSNKATYGYKWTIFGVGFVLNVLFVIVALILLQIPHIGVLLVFILIVVLMVARLGCNAVIYRNLLEKEEEESVA